VIVPASGQRISYRTLVDQSKRLANVLRFRGLRPGDHVAILMTNVPEYFEAVWAARRAGYFYTAVNWHLTPGEVRYMLENSESKALIVSADLAGLADQAAAGLPGVSLRLLVGAAAGAVHPGWDDYATPLVSAMSTHRHGGRGVNIYPREIEDLLIEHPAVDDVAVIGVPDDEYGESVQAVVTLRDGYTGGDVLEHDIIDWTRARLAHYKCPKSVTFVGSLPRSVAGKMMKHRLIEQLKQASCT
jgi:acyl-CoA synthetase (AMP-forming)/AMP-acid ligase II